MFFVHVWWQTMQAYNLFSFPPLWCGCLSCHNTEGCCQTKGAPNFTPECDDRKSCSSCGFNVAMASHASLSMCSWVPWYMFPEYLGGVLQRASLIIFDEESVCIWIHHLHCTNFVFEVFPSPTRLTLEFPLAEPGPSKGNLTEDISGQPVAGGFHSWLKFYLEEAPRWRRCEIWAWESSTSDGEMQMLGHTQGIP